MVMADTPWRWSMRSTRRHAHDSCSEAMSAVNLAAKLAAKPVTLQTTAAAPKAPKGGLGPM